MQAGCDILIDVSLCTPQHCLLKSLVWLPIPGPLLSINNMFSVVNFWSKVLAGPRRVLVAAGSRSFPLRCQSRFFAVPGILAKYSKIPPVVQINRNILNLLRLMSQFPK